MDDKKIFFFTNTENRCFFEIKLNSQRRKKGHTINYIKYITNQFSVQKQKIKLAIFNARIVWKMIEKSKRFENKEEWNCKILKMFVSIQHFLNTQNGILLCIFIIGSTCIKLESIKTDSCFTFNNRAFECWDRRQIHYTYFF